MTSEAFAPRVLIVLAVLHAWAWKHLGDRIEEGLRK